MKNRTTIVSQLYKEEKIKLKYAFLDAHLTSKYLPKLRYDFIYREFVNYLHEIKCMKLTYCAQ